MWVPIFTQQRQMSSEIPGSLQLPSFGPRAQVQFAPRTCLSWALSVGQSFGLPRTNVFLCVASHCVRAHSLGMDFQAGANKPRRNGGWFMPGDLLPMCVNPSPFTPPCLERGGGHKRSCHETPTPESVPLLWQTPSRPSQMTLCGRLLALVNLALFLCLVLSLGASVFACVRCSGCVSVARVCA